MSSKRQFTDEMRARLDHTKAAIDRLEHKVEQAETSFELEYFTRLEELKLMLEEAEQKFELFVDTHEEAWEEFKTDLERSQQSMRHIIREITGP